MSNTTTAFQLLRVMFYAVTPQETTHKYIHEVPSYIDKVTPIFLSGVLLEYVIATLRGLPRFRLNDGMSSIMAGAFQQLSKPLISPLRMFFHAYIYANYRILDLPWDSVLAWWVCLIGVDFLYYWFHRAAHEINLFWAGHQMHHSSEDYNLSTALRQSMLQDCFSWLFYIPLGFVVPTPMFMIHVQFNTIYQFWIHTEVISNLGPLEYILNTPSHHRVHHGRNPYCIDKNYGGTLIIWDRLFGTFQAETEEKVAYGLVHPLNSWNPIYAQFCHLQYIVKRVFEVEGFWNKVSTVVKGPGWEPGKPWTGDISDIPNIQHPVAKYDSMPSKFESTYVVLHGIFLLVSYMILISGTVSMSVIHLWSFVSFFFLTVTIFGMMFDNHPYASRYELCRCVLFLFCDLLLTHNNSRLAVVPEFMWMFVRWIYVASVFIWLRRVAHDMSKSKTE